MKIALVCDDLIQFGGQERLVLAASDIWPEAPIYTSVVSRKWREILKGKKRFYCASFMQKLPFAEKLNRYYSAFLLHNLAFESFDFSEFDVVLSISSRYAHHIITKPKTKHICYMNSPGRMFWESSDYFEHEKNRGKGVKRKLFDLFISYPLNIIRMLDYTASQRVDEFIANSKTPQARIKKYFRRDSHIIYPFIDLERFGDLPEVADDGYFLVVTRLAHWKRVDIAIEACKRLGKRLKVVGAGPALNDLKRLADKNIEVLGALSDDAVTKLFAGCTAFINTQYEDFGITPLEAMACGKPVIAYGRGGVLETVAPGKTGEYFMKQTVDSLAELLARFNPQEYSAESCKQQAEKFSKQRFITDLKTVVEDTPRWNNVA